MSTQQTFSLATKILKELYIGQPVKDLTYPECPFFAMVPKMEEMSGVLYPLPIKWGKTVGGSATFANAQSNTAPTKYDRFALTYAQKFQTALIEGKAIRTTKNDKGAFVNLFTSTNDDTLQGLARLLSVDLFRGSAGVIGQISSGQTTATITLVTASDAVNFEVGQTIDSSAANDGTGIRTGSAVVTGVDVENGTVTASQNWNSAISSIGGSDYLYRDGDAGLNMSGLGDWMPTSVSSNDSFFTVNRSQHSRLRGTYFAGTGAGTIEEALYRGITMSSKKGGKVTHIFMNDIDFGNLEMSLASKVVIEMKAADAEVFFEGIRLRGPKGPVGVFADNACPQGVAYGVPLMHCSLNSVGPALLLLDEDGNQWLRQATADGYEIRYGFLGQFGCADPNSLMRVDIPTV